MRSRRLLGAFAVLGTLCLALFVLDRLFPPATARLQALSAVVTDRHGAPLRIFTTPEGRWRLPGDADGVSPAYLRLLIDIEDKRFWSHPGVDPLAMTRAVAQLAQHGRVVSGGSTLTMQVVRLLEPRPRTVASKLIEVARALQLEAHWSKPDILRAYLTLAPMGGNLEGLRAGSLAWFGKEPGQLSDAEAALAVLLPQDPNGLRPDRHPARAAVARARLLGRAAAEGVIAADALPSALATPLPRERRLMPRLAPHRAEELVAAAGAPTVIPTTLDAPLQTGLEATLSDALAAIPRPVTLAAVIADWRSGAILARVGNAAYGDPLRLGAVDMTEAIRSPGSTLKPFIYGLAFETLAAHPGSLVHDAAARFDDYAPHNFDGTFNGDVTVRQALQWSLNLPAVMTLNRVGPVAFAARLAGAGVPLDLGDPPEAPSLPIALGGAGTTLIRLVSAYTALAGRGEVRLLHDQPGQESPAAAPLMSQPAADAVADILSGMPPPAGTGSRAGRIAYKTGTSYRFRDGWAIGFDGSRVAGVWMGRADGGSCDPCVGAAAAAILFRVFALLPPDPLPRRALAPVFAGPPPPTLARLDATPGGDTGPRITFPVTQSRLLVELGPAVGAAVKLAANGGTRPYHWLVDGQPLESRPFAREALWRPGQEGFSAITVVDADGRSDRAEVRVMQSAPPAPLPASVTGAR